MITINIKEAQHPLMLDLNSHPLMLDDAQNYNDLLINTLTRTINLIALKCPNYHIGHVECCILNKYNLVHS